MKKLTAFAICLIAPFALLALTAAVGPSTVTVNGSTYALGFPTAAQFYAANPPPGGGGAGVFTGSQANGVHFAWGHLENFNNINAALSIQPASGQNGFESHSTGGGGIAIVGQSDNGAPVAKLLQYHQFDYPAFMVWRQGTTVGGNAPTVEINSSGTANVLQVDANNGSVVIDGQGGIHPVHMPDSAAQNDSNYFSTTLGKMCYKDASGIVHPLY